MIRIQQLCIALTLAAMPALAQQAQDHSQHHPEASGQAPTAPTVNEVNTSKSSPAAGEGRMQMMMRDMPEQCRAAMQSMHSSCMPMMEKMLNGLTQGRNTASGAGAQGSSSSRDDVPDSQSRAHANHGAAGGSSANTVSSAPHIGAFNNAIGKMHEPMMEGVRHEDPDVAFARGMVPHHQAAIDMALVVLKYGKDEKMRKLALDVIREQNREIAEMNEWLRQKLR